MSNVFDDPKGMLDGVPFGTLSPRMAQPPLPDSDARHYALMRLREFISRLRFSRTMEKGASADPYFVPIDNIHVEQPNDIRNLVFPSVSMLAGEGKLEEDDSLGPPKMIDCTKDAYGHGTVLVLKGVYNERIGIECWGSEPAERRSLVSGLFAALTSLDGTWNMKLTLPAYYDRVASFTFDSKNYVDDPPGNQRHRRRAIVFVLMQVPEVERVRYKLMQPRVMSTTVDAQVEAQISIIQEEHNRLAPDPEP